MSSSRVLAIAGAVGLSLVSVLALVVFIAIDAQERADQPCGPLSVDGGAVPAVYVDPATVPAGPIAGYQGEQLVNAAYIMAAAQALDLSLRDQQVGVMTAMGESSLQVLDRGDTVGPDSRGLFQQRDNGAWGTYADRMDPFKSATSFFEVLAKVPGRESLEPSELAHRVQRNADPNHYRPFWSPAGEVVEALGKVSVSADAAAGSAGAGAVPAAARAAGSSSDYNLGAVRPQLEALVEVLAPMFEISTVGGYRESPTDPNGHPAGLAADFMTSSRAQGDELAAYARENAAALGIDYIIWWQRIWSVDRASQGWRPMEDRGSATENHFDHVHINVKPGAEVSGASPAGLSSDTTDCAFPSVGAGAGGVVYPVPADLADSDRENWGQSSGLWSSRHTGTDFSVPCGTPVLASHTGTIEIDNTASWSGPYLVKVVTGPDTLATWYAHMQSVSVAAGDVVQAGQQIGLVGEEGNSTGCHLHFEVHLENGSIYGPDNTDPSKWLKENVGKILGGTAISQVRVATFNALGATHTDGRGDTKPGWPDSPGRTIKSIEYFTRYAPDLVGMQEFQAGQAKLLLRRLGKTYGYVGNKDNGVMWRRDRFTLVSDTTLGIPYFGGNTRQMPVVRLQQLSTGAIVTVISIHNPASVRGPAGHWRARAVALERALVEREAAAGNTVFLVGDFNDREEAFCPLTRGGLIVAANGGSNAPGGGCRSPANDRIDWIFGTSNVAFTGYVADTSPGRRQISDHPFVVASAGPRT